MLLAIDIGNTNIVLGVFDHGRLIDHFRAATRLHLTVDEGRLLIGSALRKMHLAEKDVTHVVVGSVVPMLTSIFESTAQAGLECRALVVSHRIKLPITIGIDQPEQLGADRIANAVAGYRKFGGPVIIVDFGTATTFDVVDDRGTYLGGVITAGPETAMAELARKAARLFEVRLERPSRVIGKSTAAALKSGLFYGTVGQVDFILDKILEEAGFATCRVVATGGLASNLDRHSRHISVIDPALTLEGLQIIAEMNR